MAHRDIVVIGASAGGLDPLLKVAKRLPGDLAASVLVVLHTTGAPSVLPDILSRQGSLPALHPQDHEELVPGRVYVAAPDYHLIVKRGFVRLVHGPKENGLRPAIDPLFRSAASAYGRRVIGIVLSGTLDDGTAGLRAIKRAGGGIAIVQRPDDALFTSMPLSAIENVDVDYVLNAAEMGRAITRLVSEEVEDMPQEEWDESPKADISELDTSMLHNENKPGNPSHFTCPECRGVLCEIDDEGLLKFRRRVGHAYSPASLLDEQTQAVKAAMWAALRALEENVALTSRIAQRLRNTGQHSVARRFERRAAQIDQRAEIIRKVLLNTKVEQTSEPPSGSLPHTPESRETQAEP